VDGVTFLDAIASGGLRPPGAITTGLGIAVCDAIGTVGAVPEVVRVGLFDPITRFSTVSTVGGITCCRSIADSGRIFGDAV
jgi:hypothetical protein